MQVGYYSNSSKRIKSFLNMKISITVFLILLPIFCLPNIKGRLVDNHKNAIPYANILIKNTTIGTISNLDGDFNINIPDKYQNKVLVFSSIGFKTKEIPIKTFENKKNIIIELETSIVDLDEVTIKVKATNANQIVQKAFYLYEQNFPTNPFIGKAFLRHTEKTKTKYEWLIDAAIDVFDPGFDKPSKDIKINVNEIKRSIDNRKVDTTLIYNFYLREVKKTPFKQSQKRINNLEKEDPKEIEKAIQAFDNQKSNISKLFTEGVNVIRYYKQKDAIFDKKILKKHSFKIDSVLVYNDDEVYKIKITPKSPLTNLNKQIGKYKYPIGWIYIRAKDYAILELDYTLINSKQGQIFTLVHGSKIASSFHIKFIDINGKMYPKYISFKKPKNNKLASVMMDLANGEKVNKEDHYYETKEVLFNEIITDSIIINKYKRKSWNNDLFTPRPYNSKFWENYSDMVETKEQKILRERLEADLFKKKQHN